MGEPSLDKAVILANAWQSEVLHSPPLSLVPKNMLKAPAHNPTDPDPPAAYAALPSPSAAATLRHPDQRFLDSEAFTNKFATHLSGTMEKVTRRTLKRWSGQQDTLKGRLFRTELASDYSQDNAELGAILNGFSLSETGTLASAVETTGRAVDSTYMSTARLVGHLIGIAWLYLGTTSCKTWSNTGPSLYTSIHNLRKLSRSSLRTATRSMSSMR